MVRFTAQENALRWPEVPWGRTRLVYLQYASDPMTFFERSSAYRPPDWMIGQRGPDVSEQFRWYPVVTMFQQLLGLPVSMMGFGLPDDNLHAPNEKLHLPNFYRGIDTSIHFFSRYKELMAGGTQPSQVGSCC